MSNRVHLVEVKINPYADRLKLVEALINNSYTVKLEERPIGYSTSKDYYIQFTGDNISSTSTEDYETVGVIKERLDRIMSNVGMIDASTDEFNATNKLEALDNIQFLRKFLEEKFK